MINKASRLIAAAFDDSGINYGKQIEEYGEKFSAVEAGFKIEGGSSVLVRFISSDNDNDVSVRALSILKVPDNKREQVQRAISEANNSQRYLKFVINDKGDVSVEYDFPVKLDDNQVGKIAVEIFIRFMKGIENVYPSFMKALWA